jgi:lipopolysaccharide biosynthesis glycosyltransferase
LDTNRWFDGEIVIITDGLSQDQHARLTHFPKVRFQEPGEQLLLRIGFLCQAIPELFPKRKRFYSLEAFNLGDYDRVFFFDSDMLIVGDLSELLSLPGSLMACSDQIGRFSGRVRRKQSFKRVNPADEPNETELLVKSFNAGFMLLDKTIVNTTCYEGLLQFVHPSVFREVKTHNTDQVVFNLYFDRRASLLSTRYNVIVSKWPQIKESEKLALSDLRVVHFTGHDKPWTQDSKLRFYDDPDVAGFYDTWHLYDVD